MPIITELAFAHGDATLAGTLHRPDGAGPYPAVLMLQGSGAADRDSGGFFVPIRQRLLKSGIAVLSWDKQGIGGSSGDWRRQTIPDRAEEARAALAWLRGQPEIDAERIGVWGHSQGGWVGPRVAAMEPDVACLVIHSGTGLTPAAQDHHGMEQTLRRDGASDDVVRRGHAFLHQLHVAAELAMPYAELCRTVIEPARGKPWLDYFGAVDEGLWRYFVVNAREPLEPLWALRRVACPTLAVFGDEDVLIPVEESIALLRETMGSGSDVLTILRVPGASHRLLIGDPPAPAPGYLDHMVDWMADRLEKSSR
jgi:uncharacterized protein